jgi:hypothetical protein
MHASTLLSGEHQTKQMCSIQVHMVHELVLPGLSEAIDSYSDDATANNIGQLCWCCCYSFTIISQCYIDHQIFLFYIRVQTHTQTGFFQHWGYYSYPLQYDTDNFAQYCTILDYYINLEISCLYANSLLAPSVSSYTFIGCERGFLEVTPFTMLPYVKKIYIKRHGGKHSWAWYF